MAIACYRAAGILAATLFLSSDAYALSFDERWQSLFPGIEVVGDAVAAKAEMAFRIERPASVHRHPSYRHRAYRHRSSANRGERSREWYKGGKKWRYVYARRRSR